MEELAIFSDGLERLVLRDADRRAHDPFFEAVFRPLRTASAQGVDPTLSASLGRLLASQTIVSRTDDDTTLVLASRRPIPSGA